MSIAPADTTNLQLDVKEWLRVIDEEYLNGYLKRGGSTVKVVSGSGVVLSKIVHFLRERATAEKFHFAELDPTELDEMGRKPDLHKIDKFFLKATESLDWQKMVQFQTRQFLEQRGIRVHSEAAMRDIELLALDNGRDTADLMNEIQHYLVTPKIKDTKMTRSFRAAIAALSRAMLIKDTITPTTQEVLMEWLRGRQAPGGASALKKIQIFEKINESNARAMLYSLCHWLPSTGLNGLVVALDFRPYEEKRLTKNQLAFHQGRILTEFRDKGMSPEEIESLLAQQTEDQIFYSKLSYSKMLSLIRRFIDEIDRINRFMLLVLTTPRYYDSDSMRNYFDYDALQTRIGLEVHDARRANPSASLTHLKETT